MITTTGTQAERMARWERIAAIGASRRGAEGPVAEARAALVEAAARSPRGPGAYGIAPVDWYAVSMSPGVRADFEEAARCGPAGLVVPAVYAAAMRLGRVEAAAVAGGWSDEVARHGVPESVARLVLTMLPQKMGTGARYAAALSALSLAARGGNAERVRRLLSSALETDAPPAAAGSFVDALEYLFNSQRLPA